MGKDIDGVAFDLDGTLYPNYRFYLRIIPSIFKEFPLLLAMGKARKILRKNAGENREGFSFYENQARIMAAVLKKDPQEVREWTDRRIYRHWESFFKKIRAYPYVDETLRLFKNRGFRLAILSDFPPDTKLIYLGLDGYWDAVVCSEETGRLKPDPLPFQELAGIMHLQPERILYVGNSVPYDIEGAKKAGMKTALIL